MANPTWGSTMLNVKFTGALHPQIAPANALQEIPLLPNPTDTSSPASVLQSAGRKRFTIKVDTWVASFADYQAFYNDYISSTQRTFNGGGVNQTMLIKSITNPVYTRPSYVQFTLEFIEV